MAIYRFFIPSLSRRLSLGNLFKDMMRDATSSLFTLSWDTFFRYWLSTGESVIIFAGSQYQKLAIWNPEVLIVQENYVTRRNIILYWRENMREKFYSTLVYNRCLLHVRSDSSVSRAIFFIIKKLVKTCVQILMKPWEMYNLISHEFNAYIQMLIHQFLE